MKITGEVIVIKMMNSSLNLMKIKTPQTTMIQMEDGVNQAIQIILRMLRKKIINK